LVQYDFALFLQSFKKGNDSVAQLVEQYTFNVWVLGSSPSGITKSSKRMAFFMPCVYILYSEKLNKYYIGACSDIDRRMYEHNIGHSKFTSTGTPWKLVYKEEFETLTEAKKRENKIKSMKSRKYIEDLIRSR
jgi:putative endonuclease